MSVLNPYWERVSSGLLHSVVSPCGKLVLFNYTNHCTYEGAWDEYTASARGIIFELATGKCVARSFPKFFNLGERPETSLTALAAYGKPTVWEKVDGSLGILYWYGDKWSIATRGSFTSEQATYAQEHLLPLYDLGMFCKEYTYLVEIVYPENRILVDYGSLRSLILLGAIRTDTGEDVPESELIDAASDSGIPLTIKYMNTIEEILELQKTLPAHREGFVLHYPDVGVRVKVKGDEYLRLHKIKSQMSPLSLWEVMDSGGKVPMSYLAQLPEEFRAEVDKLANTLEEAYSRVLVAVQADLDLLPLYTPRSSPQVDFRAVGLYLKSEECRVKYPQLVFPYLRGLQDGEGRGRERLHKGVLDIIRPNSNTVNRRA